MKKKIIILLSVIILLIVSLFIYLFISYKPISKDTDKVIFEVSAGSNKLEIVDSLKEANLIRSKIASLIYVFVSPKLNLQAGTYTIDRMDSTIKIINQIGKGKTNEVIPTVQITFIEGKRFDDYAKLISNNFDITYEEIINCINDKKFLNQLIEDYWFIDNSILNNNLYYSLEGYLFPDTYEFYQNSSIENIIRKLLSQLELKLEPIKNEISKSNYSVHNILTMASIIEMEAILKEDREKVSQVIYKRLDENMNLGMDVTTYYSLKKDMKEELTMAELDTYNSYNTRNKNFLGLPVGPICSPSFESINAVIHPSNTNYLFFIADTDTGEVFFSESYEDFIKNKQELGG